MAITPRNIAKHELIGLRVRISSSKNKSLKGLSGIVVDETHNTLVIKTENGKEKIVIKKVCVFDFTLPDGTVVSVDGRLLTGRPEDRIKKKLPKWKLSELKNV